MHIGTAAVRKNRKTKLLGARNPERRFLPPSALLPPCFTIRSDPSPYRKGIVMTTGRFHGAFTALVTPFKNGKIDEEAYREFIE